MVLLILLVLALFVLQTVIPGLIRNLGSHHQMNKFQLLLGSRDNLPPQTTVGARAERALANLQEALPVFLALALLNLIVQTAGDMAVMGATIFLVARVLYLPAYLSGVFALRSLVWGVSLIGLVMMLMPLLDRI
jgi:uncharacterized MAPEG superfamily protein